MSDRVAKYLTRGRCRSCGRSIPMWTPDEIVKSIDDWVATHGTVPTWKEWEKAGPGRPTSQTLIGLFGSWGNAIQAAGHRPARTGGSVYWTRDRVIEAILDWRFERGEWPRITEWNTAGVGHPNFRTIYDLFGSWPAAMLAAGKVPRTRRELALVEASA